MPAHALFALGVYLSNPDGGNAANEAAFEAGYASFVANGGIAPVYIDSYVDGTQPIANWIQSAGWQAWSNAQSPVARTLIPVVGLPMQSTAAGAPAPDRQFRQFASGQNDSVIEGVVDAYAQQGFAKILFRVGLEMNIQGPNYAGDDGAPSQADWLAAFRRIYRVLHRRAAEDHVAVQVIWNPDTTSWTSATATQNLYPGDGFVDIIGADMYADMWPYQDGYNTNLYHDWDTGAEDVGMDSFMADPVNREHYWNYPAATQFSNDSSGGHALSFNSLIAFAEAHRKPFAVPEAGAGNTEAGHDVGDDAAFPLWLAQTLTTAETAGLRVAFVTVWDSQGAGNYAFSNALDGKPQEAASWAKYLGAEPAVAAGSPLPPVACGSGRDTLVVRLAEDAWQGDAQFTLSVDGVQQGGVLTTTASNAASQNQPFVLHGAWGPGPHTVAVNYLNDANDGTVLTDRNLYLVAASYDGVVNAKHTLSLFGGGVQTVIVGVK